MLHSMRFPAGAGFVPPVGKLPPAQSTPCFLKVRTLWFSQIFLGGEIYKSQRGFLVGESAMEFKVGLSLQS